MVRKKPIDHHVEFNHYSMISFRFIKLPTMHQWQCQLLAVRAARWRNQPWFPGLSSILKWCIIQKCIEHLSNPRPTFFPSNSCHRKWKAHVFFVRLMRAWIFIFSNKWNLKKKSFFFLFYSALPSTQIRMMITTPIKTHVDAHDSCAISHRFTTNLATIIMLAVVLFLFVKLKSCIQF